MATDISFDTVTNATTTEDGTGYFDIIMKTTLLHIKEEWNEGRIKGTDYATVYLGAMQSAMTQATQFALQEKSAEAQADLVIAQTATEADKVLTAVANREVLEQQALLYIRQKQGFDDNKHQKVLETAMSAWSMTFADAGSTVALPNAVASAAVLDQFFLNAMSTDATGINTGLTEIDKPSSAEDSPLS